MIQYLPHGKFRLSRRNPVCVIIFGLEQSRVYLLGKQLQMWRPFKVDRGSFFDIWHAGGRLSWKSSPVNRSYRAMLCMARTMLSQDVCLSVCLSHAGILPQSNRSTVGDRAFLVAGPHVWNSLPPEVTSAPSLDTFRKRLKTHLFTVSYSNIQLS